MRRSVPNAAVAKCGPARHRRNVIPLGRQRGTIQRGVHDVNLPLVRVGHDDFVSNNRTDDADAPIIATQHQASAARQDCAAARRARQRYGEGPLQRGGGPDLGRPRQRDAVGPSRLRDTTKAAAIACQLEELRRGKRNMLRRSRRLIHRPEFDLAIAGAGRQEMAVRREIHRRNWIRVAAQRPGFLPTRSFPEADGRITSHRRQPAPIGRKHRALSEGGIAQFRNQGSVFGAPNLGWRFAARIHQPSPIGRESQNAETARRIRQNAKLPAFGQIPEGDVTGLVRDDQHTAIRREESLGRGARFGFKWLQPGFPIQIPEADLIGESHSEHLLVGRDVQRPDRRLRIEQVGFSASLQDPRALHP